MMNRRHFLEIAGAGAAATAFGTLPAAAQTKPESIVVMTWGGLWGDAMRDNVDAAFQKATGIKVVQDRSSSPVERITKLKVSLNDQKVDLVQLHDGLVPLAIKQGVVEKLNKESPRMGHVRRILASEIARSMSATVAPRVRKPTAHNECA